MNKQQIRLEFASALPHSDQADLRPLTSEEFMTSEQSLHIQVFYTRV